MLHQGLRNIPEPGRGCQWHHAAGTSRRRDGRAHAACNKAVLVDPASAERVENLDESFLCKTCTR